MNGLDALAHRLRPPHGEPEGTLILLHGRGADEHDLLPLLDILDPNHRLLGATARGPLRLPPGGAHWYAVRQIGYPDPGTFLPTYERLATWIDALLAEFGLAHDRAMIGGFSQGTVMSYAVGLGKGRPTPSGIIALSGFIPTVEGFALDLESRERLPVAVGHGSLDPVIGVKWGREARDRLEAAGAEVTYRESPIEHQIDPAFLATLPAWVESCLGRRDRRPHEAQARM